MPESLTFTSPVFASLAGLVFFAWVVLALYALIRAGRSAKQVRQLESGQHFLRETLRTDRRRPVWLWRSGRIQADSEALAMLGIADQRDMLEGLIGTEAYGLPRLLVEDIRTALSAGRLADMPAFLDFGDKRPGVHLEIKPLGGHERIWPNGVIWLETRSETAEAEASSLASYAIEKHMEELRTTFDMLPFPIWERNEEFRLVRVNRAYVTAVDGISEEQVIQDQVELFDNVLTRTPKDAARQVLRSGNPMRERHFGVIQGQRRALFVTNSRMPDRTATLGVAIDVTGEEEALAELSRVLDAQSETLNRLHSPVAIFGPDKHLRFFNSAFAKLSGIDEDWLSKEPSHGELIDQMHARRRMPEYADFRAWKAETLARYTEVLEPVEEMWHLPDGSTHRLVTQPHPLGGLLLLFEDVTDRLTLERSYNTLAAVQRETLDNLREAISVFGSDGCLQLYNPTFSDLMQLDEAYLLSRPHLADVMARTTQTLTGIISDSAYIEHFLGLLAEHRADSGQLKRVDGKYIDYVAVPLPDGAMLISQVDVTDSVQMEHALRERNEALEAADRVKSEFISSVSYELRTPLNSIMGFAEMLKGQFAGPLNDKQRDYVGSILEAADKLNDMIADVLDMAVIEAGEMELDFGEFDIAEMVSKVVGGVTSRSGRQRAEIMVSLTETIGRMEGDRTRIEQALYNLLVSTLRLAHVNTIVHFTVTEVNPDRLAFVVRCEETSLDVEEYEEVEAAFRLGRNLGPRGGLGLDLALVRSFIELHEGSVDFELNTGTGLRIECQLPSHQTSALGRAH